MIGRRVALQWLALAAATPLVGGRRAEAERLSAAERRLALLGARLAAESPATASRLARSVARRVARGGPSRTRPAARARDRLLAPARLRRELERGRVLVVDGWVLARSEVALCAYLHSLAARSGRAER